MHTTFRLLSTCTLPRNAPRHYTTSARAASGVCCGAVESGVASALLEVLVPRCFLLALAPPLGMRHDTHPGGT